MLELWPTKLKLINYTPFSCSFTQSSWTALQQNHFSKKANTDSSWYTTNINNTYPTIILLNRFHPTNLEELELQYLEKASK